MKKDDRKKQTPADISRHYITTDGLEAIRERTKERTGAAWIYSEKTKEGEDPDREGVLYHMERTPRRGCSIKNREGTAGKISARETFKRERWEEAGAPRKENAANLNPGDFLDYYGRFYEYTGKSQNFSYNLTHRKNFDYYAARLPEAQQLEAYELSRFYSEAGALVFFERVRRDLFTIHAIAEEHDPWTNDRHTLEIVETGPYREIREITEPDYKDIDFYIFVPGFYNGAEEIGTEAGDILKRSEIIDKEQRDAMVLTFDQTARLIFEALDERQRERMDELTPKVRPLAPGERLQIPWGYLYL